MAEISEVSCDDVNDPVFFFKDTFYTNQLAMKNGFSEVCLHMVLDDYIDVLCLIFNGHKDNAGSGRRPLSPCHEASDLHEAALA